MEKELRELVKKNKIVSFDIFDTLLFRNVSRPTDVFKTIDNYILEKYNIDNFTEKRIEAERVSRTKKASCEVTLEEIYDELDIKKNIKEEIKSLELERELEFIEVNPFMKDILEYSINENKKVYLISDMYLSSEFIKKLLEKAGYKNIPKIYVSCECDAKKGDATLFEYVKNKEKLDYSKWLHIGDSYNSDYKMPKKLGMEAYNYKNVNTYNINDSKSVFESIFLGMINNKTRSGIQNDYYKNFAIKYISSIYFGFTNYIYLNNINQDNLFFLARDGYIIKKIYELFPKIDNQYLNYLYVSRKSLLIPELYNSDRERLINLLVNGSISKTIKKLLNKALIDIDNIDNKILYAYNFESLEDVIDENNSYNASKLLAHLINESSSKYDELYKVAKEYLIQEGLDKYNNINIVDVGWAGSIQNSIRNIMNKKVIGYYFGTNKSTFKDYMTDSFGYAFDLGEPYEKMESICNKNVMMYELIFSAPHGSTIGYKKDTNGIKPVLDESDDFKDFLESIQNESISFIKEVMKYYKYFDSFSSNFAISFYEDFLSKRKYEDLIVFDKISNDCLFGSNDKIKYVAHITKEEIINKKNYKELAKRLSNDKEDTIFNELWYQAYLIDGANTKEEYDNLREEFELFLRKRTINAYLDKYYEYKDDYYRILKKTIMIKDKDLQSKIVNKYYNKYHPDAKKKIIRKIVPFKIRKRLKKIINKIENL